jgi:hypothetical protein
MADSVAQPQPSQASWLKRTALATAMAIVAINIWTGSPLLALWIGSKVQGESGQPSMGAVFAVIACLCVFSFLLYQLMKRIGAAYDDATGHTPSVRTHAPWLRSMRDERHEYAEMRNPVSATERIVVVMVVLAAVAFEVWFFFFAGSPF